MQGIGRQAFQPVIFAVVIAVQPQKIAAVGIILGVDRQIQPCAVLARADQLGKDVNALVFPVDNQFAEADVGRILHTFAGDVVPHIIAQQGHIQKGAVQRPFVVRWHPHQALGIVFPVFIHQLEPVAEFIKIPGGIAAGVYDDAAGNGRHIRKMVVPGGTVHHLHGGGNAVAAVGGRDKADMLAVLHHTAAGDLYAAGIDTDKRKVGAEFPVGMCHTALFFLRFSVLVDPFIGIAFRQSGPVHQADQQGRGAGDDPERFILHRSFPFLLCKTVCGIQLETSSFCITVFTYSTLPMA